MSSLDQMKADSSQYNQAEHQWHDARQSARSPKVIS